MSATVTGNSPRTDVTNERGRIRIIHVAESYGGGVASAIHDYVRNTPTAEHHLIYAERLDAPIRNSELEIFESATKLPAGQLSRIRWLRKSLKARTGVIVHAHSSFAGAYARLALRSTDDAPIVYTPHCYAFERTDISPMKKLAFRAFEYILSFNTDTVAACSIREARLSGWNSNQSAAVFVPNVPPLTSLHRAEPKGKSGTLRIVGAGRLGPQKDPDFFISTIQALRKAGHTFEAIWIGGGDPNLTAKLADQNIKVTGWLSRHEAIVQLRSADVYIHTAAWEGFPITLIEAVSLNVPVIARAIPALEGVMLPALIDRSSEILNFWEMMISRESREELLRSCRVGLKDYVDSQQRQGLESAYQGRAQRINGLAEKIQA